MRLAIAGFAHETNSFAVEQNDALDARVLAGAEIAAGVHPKSFVGGFLEVASRAAVVELVPTVLVHPVLGGRLALGTWQSIALVDLNVDNQTRDVRLSYVG